MATFNNTIGTAGNVIQTGGDATFNGPIGGNVTIGGPIASTEDLRQQVAELQALLAKTPDIPEETRTTVAATLREAGEVPATAPGAASIILGKLDTAKSFLSSITGIATGVMPLIGAIGAIATAAAGLVV